MPDPFSGGLGTTKQETTVLKAASDRKRAFNSKVTKDKENDTPAYNQAKLYKMGIALLKEKGGFVVELDETGDHVNHRILKATHPRAVEGIRPPANFMPLQDISSEADFENLEACFHKDLCPKEVRDFWEPLFRPKAGDNDLLSFTQRMLKMRRMQNSQNVHQVLTYGHTFDPTGRLGGEPVLNPRIWVPDHDWFEPQLRELTFADVFSIFPKAEQEMLQLILGRIGVGRSNHQPPGQAQPVDHTARMAGVIVGKDVGLGKSTLFNGLTKALQNCGFVTHTFKSTEDRFGLKAAALSDIAYKDDTSLPSLKKFLAAEETKILITNGLFQVEEKFEKPEQIWPKTVILVNSNDWNSKFAYDLDPGIIDRIKLISTYREYEVLKNREYVKGTLSEGSPDLRPRSHIPWLANKLNVSEDALYLWCLRLATDKFYNIITDRSDPSINRLQYEVRYWTTRQRIRFKADLTQAIINALAFSWLLRTGETEIPELTPTILNECLNHFYFVGVDPSSYPLMCEMKKQWDKAGRPSTHYYQGFREVRWESVEKATLYYMQYCDNASISTTTTDIIKDTMEKLVIRDGFKIGGAANYVIENWENMRHASDELLREGQELIEQCDKRDQKRICNGETRVINKWLGNKNYSPDRAEALRAAAREEMYKKGV